MGLILQGVKSVGNTGRVYLNRPFRAAVGYRLSGLWYFSSELASRLKATNGAETARLEVKVINDGFIIEGEKISSRLVPVLNLGDKIDKINLCGSLSARQLRQAFRAIDCGFLTPEQPFLISGMAMLQHGKELFIEQSNLAKIQREAAEFREHSTTDRLTGLLNDRVFGNRLEAGIKEVLASKREERRTGSSATKSLILIYLDLNGLKEINDTWKEHKIGDMALQCFANALRNCFKREHQDFLFRLSGGGDEFAVLIGPVAGAYEPVKIKTLLENLEREARKQSREFKRQAEEFLFRKGRQIDIPEGLIRFSAAADCFRPDIDRNAESFRSKIDTLLYVQKALSKTRERATTFKVED